MSLECGGPTPPSAAKTQTDDAFYIAPARRVNGECMCSVVYGGVRPPHSKESVLVIVVVRLPAIARELAWCVVRR
jgi:hypothetical protein